MKKGLTPLQRGFFLVVMALFAGCGSNSVNTVPVGSTVPVVTPTPVATGSPRSVASASPSPSPSPTMATVTGSCLAGANSASIGSAGGSVSTAASSGMLTETIAAGKLATNTTVTLGYEAASALPAPLALAMRQESSGRRTPLFTAGSGNTYIAAFCTGFTGSTPSSAVSLSATGVAPVTIGVGTQFNIAMYVGSTYVDVGTAVVTASGSFSSTAATVALPGITQTGSYLIYQPASGTNTTQINLGFALIADDGSGSVANGFQFVQIEDGNGNAVPTPTTTFFPVAATDLDGESLTPDASHGASVDGSNLVYFFSGIPQHTFALSPQTVNVTAYGGDGDAIASLPSGDQVVVSANGTQLAVISGILSGTPVVADTINNGNMSTYDRDGLTISGDGTVLLSRGYTGLDIFSVAKVAPHAGSTNTGTTSFAFTLTKSFSTTGGAISAPYFEDGREGMAISPTDPTRAVIVGSSPTYTPEVQLLTGLGSASPTVSSDVRAMFTAQARVIGNDYRRPEPSPHRQPLALTPTVGTTLYAVSITPDGTTAFVSTDAGILTFTGVNTGTLVQAGGAYRPLLPLPNGGTCPLASAASIGVLPDGKYLVAAVSCSGSGLAAGTSNSTQGTGVMVTIPIGAGGVLGAPAGQLNNVVTPFNDQIIFH